MKFETKTEPLEAVRISLKDESGKEIGNARVNFLKNDFHEEPYAHLEYLFVDENHRGKGLGIKLFDKALEVAKSKNAYKFIGTSRKENQRAHELYKKLGFNQYGYSFRIKLIDYKTSHKGYGEKRE